MPDWPSDLDETTVSSHEVSGLLGQWSSGRPGAFEELFPLIYGELRELAIVERDCNVERIWLHRRHSS